MAKFKDPDTEEIVEITEWTTSFKNGDTIYKDKFNHQLVSQSGKPLELQEENKEFDPNKIPQFLTFSSKSSSEKKAILQKRSHDHYEKNIKERQIILNKGESL